MQKIEIKEATVEGAVSVERGDGWLRPWRIPFKDRACFVAPGDSLVDRARYTSGVRLRFETDSDRIGLDFLPLGTPSVNETHVLDLTIEADLAATACAPEGAEAALFEGLPRGAKIVELWLPHDDGIALTGLRIDDGAACRVVPDSRLKWITYGSSLTHCVRAHGSGRTWPAIVARKKQWNVTSLGYGGNCCLEPMVGMMIRDLPADFISLKLGINCIGGALAPRTFPGAVMGLIQIIREKHPETPMAVISPMAYPPNETKPNVVGNTVQRMREDIEDVVSRLKDRGDKHLAYFSGLDLFNSDEIAEYTQDQCHPNGDGIELMADHFLERILPGKRPLSGAAVLASA